MTTQDLIRVVDSPGWIGLVMALTLILTGIAWSVLGAVPLTVSGDGLLQLENLHSIDIKATQAGWLRRALPIGTKVTAGGVVATIDPVDAVEQRRTVTTPLANTIELATSVVSPVDGTVVAHFANAGQRVDFNSRLLTVQTGDTALQAMLFIAADEGKQVKVGMDVQVTPSIAAAEEYGQLRGRVAWVSPLPRSQAELASDIGQEELAGRFVRAGAPIEVHVKLQPDSQSNNGYAWTSSKGRRITLSRGAIVHGAVVVRREPPIIFAVPALKHWLGVS